MHCCSGKKIREMNLLTITRAIMLRSPSLTILPIQIPSDVVATSASKQTPVKRDAPPGI
jgi:hypothetical protein